jgi:large subunit ribosomal protein L10
MPAQKKIETVENIKNKLGKANAFFLADYKGLTHQQLEGLRKVVKNAEGEFSVVKNRLFGLALKENKNKALEKFIEDIKAKLTQSTGIFFAYGEEISLVKAISEFIKNHQLPIIKIGFFADNIATEADFKKLSNLPTKEVLIATLLNRIQSPLYGLHRALNWNMQSLVTVLENIKNKKPATS